MFAPTNLCWPGCNWPSRLCVQIMVGLRLEWGQLDASFIPHTNQGLKMPLRPSSYQRFALHHANALRVWKWHGAESFYIFCMEDRSMYECKCVRLLKRCVTRPRDGHPMEAWVKICSDCVILMCNDIWTVKKEGWSTWYPVELNITKDRFYTLSTVQAKVGDDSQWWNMAPTSQSRRAICSRSHNVLSDGYHFSVRQGMQN